MLAFAFTWSFWGLGVLGERGFIPTLPGFTVIGTFGPMVAVSLSATGLAAVMFQPLRDRLQRGVNRLIYGERGIFTKLQVSDRSQAIVHAREAGLGTRGDSPRS